MVVLAAAIAAVATVAELAKNIKEMTSLIPKAPTELTQKHRWMTVTVFNQTQFPLVFMDSWFDSGRFWDPPGDIKPFKSGTFSVCSKDNSILTGVTGGAQFELRMPMEGGGYKSLDIAVGFARPEVGAVKCSGIYNSSSEQAYKAVSTDTMRHTSGEYSGINVNGKQVTINFQTVASPGEGASVTITQQVVET